MELSGGDCFCAYPCRCNRSVDVAGSAVHMSIKLCQLQQERKRLGMSVMEVARESNLSREMVYRIERGDNVTIYSMSSYLHSLGLRIDIVPDWPDCMEVSVSCTTGTMVSPGSAGKE